MKKHLIILMGISMVLTSAFAAVPEKLHPTEKEKTAILNEADDFIDDMAEGLQDRQSDAVLHALRGQTQELMMIRKMRDVGLEASADVVTEDIIGTGSARGIKMRLYKNKAAVAGKRPLLIYLHGGGWTFGSINSCAKFCDALASGGIITLAVEYSLAPESPFPGGLMDCVSAVEYALAHASEWGSSEELVSLGGDSSGGNLALATALYLQDNPEVKLRSLVLFYPVVKAYADGSGSWRKYSRGYGLDGRLMKAFNEAYTGHTDAVMPPSSKSKGDSAAVTLPAGDAAADPLVSPALASDAKLRRLPPVLIVAAGRDILYDQGKEFALKVKRLGVGTDYVELPGAVHLFITVDGQPTAFSKAVALTERFLSAD